jgi:hypothetical protein
MKNMLKWWEILEQISNNKLHEEINKLETTEIEELKFYYYDEKYRHLVYWIFFYEIDWEIVYKRFSRNVILVKSFYQWSMDKWKHKDLKGFVSGHKDIEVKYGWKWKEKMVFAADLRRRICYRIDIIENKFIVKIRQLKTDS